MSKMKANEISKAQQAQQADRSHGMRGENEYGCNRKSVRTLRRQDLAFKSFRAAAEARRALAQAARPTVVVLTSGL